MKNINSDIVALIPARSGSKRIPDKNIRLLHGRPVIVYTIIAAKQSKIFSRIIVSTDSEKYAEISREYGAEVPFLRPAELAKDLSPDIDWIDFTLTKLGELGQLFEYFCILRPTNPFRQPETIRRAWEEFKQAGTVDSLRAVQKVREHPGKMWMIRNNRMSPLLPLGSEKLPWHSAPFQSLPEVYSQNASLEIACTRVIAETYTISGNSIVPFFTEEFEGFDLNTLFDWEFAEYLVSTGKVRLPKP